MKTEGCKSCKKFFGCELKNFLPFPENGCSDFVSVKKHNYVLIHKRLDSGFYFIVAFGDSFLDMIQMRDNLPDYGKKNHDFYVVSNSSTADVASIVNYLKDDCLLRICENVAFGLSRAEYHILKHRYTKSKFCFDKTFKQISDACYILENY